MTTAKLATGEPPDSLGPTHLFHLSRLECTSVVEKALDKNKQIRQLVTAMKEAGCPIARSYFHVTACSGNTHGGFSLEHGVILCHNQLSTATEVENAMVHELIHAYDFCRIKDMDFGNCAHHACTEVRAASLSGDCSPMQELSRGQLSMDPRTWLGSHVRCVRRRAALSVAMNPSCGGADGAAAVVDAVFDKCAEDCAPFPQPP